MVSSPQKASIVVPCRNEKAHIERCIRSIQAQENPELVMEVLVVDGMSDDGTREILRRLEAEDGKIKVLDNREQIVSTGLNTAIRVARGDIIIRMDAHTEYAVDYVRHCVDTLRSSQADNVGGPWVAKGEGYLSRAIAAAFQSPFAVGGARSHSQAYEGDVDSVYLGCWPKQSFLRFGRFDEDLVRNQDDEHNLRIRRGGGKVWQNPTIRSWYRPRGSLEALFRQYSQYGYWKVRVIQKHKLPASWRHLVPGAFVLSLLILVILSGVCLLSTNLLAPRFPLSALYCVLLIYAVAVLIASIVTAARAGCRLLLVLPLVFTCYHFGYGIGFLCGTWDFVIRKVTPRLVYRQITR
jgi:glycosyltransferase involved in cell wall biosynthesis